MQSTGRRKSGIRAVNSNDRLCIFYYEGEKVQIEEVFEVFL